MRQVMKALLAGTVNLVDGSILVLDPNHTTDNRARFPTVTNEKDVERLERDGWAEVHEGRIPALDTEKAKEEEADRSEQARKSGLAGDQGAVLTGHEQAAAAAAAAAGKDAKGAKAPAGKAKAAAGKAAGDKPAAKNPTGRNGATKPAAGVETDAEAAAAAGAIEGDDPTEAPAGGAARQSD